MFSIVSAQVRDISTRLLKDWIHSSTCHTKLLLLLYFITIISKIGVLWHTFFSLGTYCACARFCFFDSRSLWNKQSDKWFQNLRNSVREAMLQQSNFRNMHKSTTHYSLFSWQGNKQALFTATGNFQRPKVMQPE